MKILDVVAVTFLTTGGSNTKSQKFSECEEAFLPAGRQVSALIFLFLFASRQKERKREFLSLRSADTSPHFDRLSGRGRIGVGHKLDSSV